VAKRRSRKASPARSELHQLLTADVRSMTAHSDRIGRHFARQHGVLVSDIHALLHIMMAEHAGQPLTLSQLRKRMNLSPASVTYLVDRMTEAGHIRREADPADRRKSLLRFEDHGLAVGREFFSPLGAHLRVALADTPDADLVVAQRVMRLMIAAMAGFEEGLPGRGAPS
jgi:DNA-binding MarR family transcriptional regulator